MTQQLILLMAACLDVTKHACVHAGALIATRQPRKVMWHAQYAGIFASPINDSMRR